MVWNNGVALSPMPFNFPLEYATMRAQVNQSGLKLKGTHQLPIMLVTLICRKKNTEALAVDSKEVGHLVNADKSKYMACFEIRMHDVNTI